MNASAGRCLVRHAHDGRNEQCEAQQPEIAPADAPEFQYGHRPTLTVDAFLHEQQIGGEPQDQRCLQQAQRNKALLEDLLRQREQDAAQQRPNASQTSRSGETEPAPTAAAKPSQQQNLEERPTRPSAALQNRQQASAERLQAAGPDDEPPADSTELPAPTADEGKLSDESRQALEQWLRQIPDEPSELLRRKFWYQQQQRQENLP